LSLSPTHALFAADDNHFTPYSPSSRLFHNILLADPRATFDVGRVEQAQAHGADAAELARFEANELIDWPRAGRARKAMLRALFDSFRDCELLTPSHPLAADFSRFCAAGGDALEKHATFEAIHAKQFSRDFTKWHWRDWPAELRDCNSPIVRGFAASNPNEIGFHKFAQWLVDRSIRKAQGMALGAGMRIGLVSDLAVGMNDGGSHAWSAPNDLLLGLSIGAPPDPLAPRGQNWGLTNFSPHALVEAGFAPFLATLRAALRHAGGARIDHVMGVSRLWLTPDGMDANEGAYLRYPQMDLLRLLRLESRRHQAIVIGEDLGTVPDGMREQLSAAGVFGLRVLQFERREAGFNPPGWYPASAAAMPSTHDTATMAGWWSGADLETRARIDQLPLGQSLEAARSERAEERAALWNAFRFADVAARETQPPLEHTATIIDSSVAFLAKTPAQIVLLPLEEALGLVEQPNLPGTTIEHPNWRRRYPGQANGCLDNSIAVRLRPLVERREHKAD
jgi:4-alpha-glucanotransferase